MTVKSLFRPVFQYPVFLDSDRGVAFNTRLFSGGLGVGYNPYLAVPLKINPHRAAWVLKALQADWVAGSRSDKVGKD